MPLQCETLAHRGVGQFLRTVNDVQQITNADLSLLGALLVLGLVTVPFALGQAMRLACE